MNMHKYMSKKQRKKAKEFLKNHNTVYYKIYPGFIGESLTIYCETCDKEKDLTDYSKW